MSTHRPTPTDRPLLRDTAIAPTEGSKRTRVDNDGTEHKEILRWADATTDPEMELWVTRIIMALFFAVGLYLGHNGLPF